MLIWDLFFAYETDKVKYLVKQITTTLAVITCGLTSGDMIFPVLLHFRIVCVMCEWVHLCMCIGRGGL